MTTEEIIDSILTHQSVIAPPWKQLQLRAHRIDSHFVSRGNTIDPNDKIWDDVNVVMTRDRLPFINFKPDYKKAYSEGKIKLADNIVAQKYHKEISDTYLLVFKKLLDAPSNNRYVLIRDTMDYLGFTIKQVDDNPAIDNSVRISFVKDDKGWITGFDIMDPMMEQSAIFIEDILEHHGIKGMKWGVRKSVSSRVQRVKKARARAKSPEVTVVDKGKKIKTSGGKGLPAHPDAIRARMLGQAGKKSGHKSLSNAELKAFNERLNLEQQAKRLQFQDQGKAKKFISTLLGKGANKGVDTGTRAALNSSIVKKTASRGAAALAVAF